VRQAKAGDLVLLLGQDRKSFIRTLKPGGQLQTHRGILSYDALIGQPLGALVNTHLGYPFFMLTPSTEELLRTIRRKSQIIFPKDAGYIVLKLGVQPGVTVVEAGTGSGGLTSVFATHVSDTGHVYSYDVRADMQSVALGNMQRLGLEDRVSFVQRDIAEGFAAHEADCLFLDLVKPWEYLDQARAAMAGGSMLGSLVPTANQLVRLIRALDQHQSFAFVEAEELTLRTWKTVPGRVRPADRMVAHTGFLIFARAVLPPPDTSSGNEGPSEAE
jgi:tRNA (adenine57-N1/adenine58-N1)-methyltransferase